MAVTTTTEVSTGIGNAFLDRVLLTRAVANFVHVPLGQEKKLDENSGTTVTFRRYGNLTAATGVLTEGTTPASKQLSIVDVTATLAQYGTFVEISDKLAGTNLTPVLADVAPILGDNAGDSLDQVTRDVVNVGTVAQIVGGGADTSSVAAGDDLGLTNAATELRAAVLTLKNANARLFAPRAPGTPQVGTLPIRASYWGIVHPATTATLKEASEFTEVHEYPSSLTPLPNEVGEIEGVRMIESTNATVFVGSGGAGIDVYATIIFGEGAYGVVDIEGSGPLAMRMITKDFGEVNDPLDQRATAGWKAFFAAIILNENFMVRIEHAAA